MMVISTGDPLPELAVVVIARWLWRYRSELAPLGVALALAGPGWWLHVALPPWWRAGPGRRLAAACAVVARSARGSACPAGWNGSTPASAVLAGGTWRPLAAALGPLAPPLPQCSGHRRRWCWRCRGGRTAAGAPRSAWSAPSPPGRTSPGAVGLAGSAGHVRHGGPVGLAGPVPAGPWPDHHRRDGEDTRDRIGARHAPRRGPRLPDPR